ncbi:hypothetical protein B5S32_g652 [[Candida] boidinii]|nr:hypothetical protein B5S32_g652 [[Candida] boidinii]
MLTTIGRIQRCSYPPNSLGKVGRSLALRNSRLFSTISGNDHYSPLKHRQNIQNFKRYRSSFTRATTSKPRRPHGSSRYDDNVSNRERIMTPEELLQQAGNVDIEKVKSELAERHTIRYERPNAFWIENSLKWDLKKLQDRLAMSPIKDSKMVRDVIRKRLIKEFGDLNRNFNISDLYYESLDVGDVVDLSDSFASKELTVIVALPTDPEDARYTLINQYGEILFVSKSKMGIRIPKVFPKEWFNDCIFEESQFLVDENNERISTQDITPIGKVKYSIEDDLETSRLYEGALTNNKNFTTTARHYIIPSILSGIISKELTNLVNTAWNYLPEVNLKLEVLHNVLQSTESPFHLPLVTLYKAIDVTNLKDLVQGLSSQEVTQVNKAFKKIFNKLNTSFSLYNQFDSIALGRKVIGELEMNSSVDVSLYYAFILGLRKNDQIFHHSSSSQVPYSVTIIPLNRIVQYNKIVNSFKSDTELFELTSLYMTKRMNHLSNSKQQQEESDKNADDSSSIENFEKPVYYNDLIELLKLYCAGSFNDNRLESFVIKIIRNVPFYKDSDITGSKVYELLLKLGEVKPSDDPSLWWYDSLRPGSGISGKADAEQELYDSITEDNLSHFIDFNHDPVRKIRKDFTEDVIYCIDSESALEIDDGISINKISDEEWIISSYIANPSSYLKPKDIISAIAFERGMTLYLPKIENKSGQNSVGMFPDALSQTIQLGSQKSKTKSDKKVRVLKINFKYNPITKEISRFDDNENEIQFGYAKNFVNIDYQFVDLFLKGDKSAEPKLNTVVQKFDISKEKLFEDLNKLKEVSYKLLDNGKKNGRLNSFISYRKDLETVAETDDQSIKLELKDDKIVEGSSDSQILVSEIMIMSNSVAAGFFKRNEIPAVFRIQNKLATSEPVAKFLEDIKNKNLQEISLADSNTMKKYLGSTYLTSVPSAHYSLGVECYSTVTSPLRRFNDVINHWQLQNFLTGGRILEKNNIDFCCLHLMLKEHFNKEIGYKISGFYIYKYLNQLQAEKGDQKFRCIVTSAPSSDGLVQVILLDFGVRSVLHTSQFNLKDSDPSIKKIQLSEISVGDIIDDAIIEDVDLIDGTIVLTSPRY